MLEYYAIYQNFNTQNIERINVLNGLEKGINFEKIENKAELKKILKITLMSQFWSRAEYEVMIGGLFSKKDEFEKIDIWYQLEPNLDIITDYVARKMNIN